MHIPFPASCRGGWILLLLNKVIGSFATAKLIMQQPRHSWAGTMGSGRKVWPILLLEDREATRTVGSADIRGQRVSHVKLMLTI